MTILKVIILLLIISSTFVDARARRKRRQLSSGSYYISNVNPYSTSYNPNVALTYPSGSYYSAPSYGYPNTGYSGDVPFNTNNYGTDMSQYGPLYSYNYNTYYPSGTNQNYQYQNLGSTYGSGLYGTYGSGLYGYGPAGFNNLYPNWNQGNSAQYYTGGTGSGLVNTGYFWYRSLRNTPFQGRSGDNLEGNPAALAPPVLTGKKAADSSPGK